MRLHAARVVVASYLAAVYALAASCVPSSGPPGTSVAVVVAPASIDAGSSADSAPLPAIVQLDQLLDDPARFDGQRIRVTGTVISTHEMRQQVDGGWSWRRSVGSCNVGGGDCASCWAEVSLTNGAPATAGWMISLVGDGLGCRSRGCGTRVCTPPDNAKVEVVGVVEATHPKDPSDWWDPSIRVERFDLR